MREGIGECAEKIGSWWKIECWGDEEEGGGVEKLIGWDFGGEREFRWGDTEYFGRWLAADGGFGVVKEWEGEKYVFVVEKEEEG